MVLSRRRHVDGHQEFLVLRDMPERQVLRLLEGDTVPNGRRGRVEDRDFTEFNAL
ncbi:MAG: hypothetical protein ACI9OJ_003892 [Myxococcota bacterium]